MDFAVKNKYQTKFFFRSVILLMMTIFFPAVCAAQGTLIIPLGINAKDVGPGHPSKNFPYKENYLMLPVTAGGTVFDGAGQRVTVNKPIAVSPKRTTVIPLGNLTTQVSPTPVVPRGFNTRFGPPDPPQPTYTVQRVPVQNTPTVVYSQQPAQRTYTVSPRVVTPTPAAPATQTVRPAPQVRPAEPPASSASSVIEDPFPPGNTPLPSAPTPASPVPHIPSTPPALYDPYILPSSPVPTDITDLPPSGSYASVSAENTGIKNSWNPAPAETSPGTGIFIPENKPVYETGKPSSADTYSPNAYLSETSPEVGKISPGGKEGGTETEKPLSADPVMDDIYRMSADIPREEKEPSAAASGSSPAETSGFSGKTPFETPSVEEKKEITQETPTINASSTSMKFPATKTGDVHLPVPVPRHLEEMMKETAVGQDPPRVAPAPSATIPSSLPPATSLPHNPPSKSENILDIYLDQEPIRLNQSGKPADAIRIAGEQTPEKESPTGIPVNMRKETPGDSVPTSLPPMRASEQPGSKNKQNLGPSV